MADGYITTAVAAAVALARRLGLPAEAPQVLASRSNVLVRLGPAVARVPATTLLARSDLAQRMASDVPFRRSSRTGTHRSYRLRRAGPALRQRPSGHVVTCHTSRARAPLLPRGGGRLAGRTARSATEFPGELAPDGPVVETPRW